jgi:hypothetical protein
MSGEYTELWTELRTALCASLFALPAPVAVLASDWPTWYRASAIWALTAGSVYTFGRWMWAGDDDEIEETDVSDEPADRAADQRELVEQLVHVVAPNWSKTFDQPEQLHFNDLPERLDATVHSVFTELDGDGGIQPHRLTPQSSVVSDLNLLPELDLFACEDPNLASAYDHIVEGNHTEMDSEEFAFVDALWFARNETIALTPTQPEEDYARRAVGSLLTEICGIIEAGYVLVPQFFDDEGEFEEEGEDIAPGLTAAFTAEWENAGKAE